MYLPDWYELFVPLEVVLGEQIGSDGEVYEFDVQRRGDTTIPGSHVPEDHVILRQELQTQRRLPAHLEEKSLSEQEVSVHRLSLRGGAGGRGGPVPLLITPQILLETPPVRVLVDYVVRLHRGANSKHPAQVVMVQEEDGPSV